MNFFSGFGCLFSVFFRFWLTACQPGTDKIKEIKIRGAIKCRIPHILIPLSYRELFLSDQVPIYNKV